MMREVRRVIAPDHPAMAGHFPGNPIVPGVVILEEVARAAGSLGHRSRLARIETAKFRAPLPPGVAFVIRLADGERGRVDFTVERDGEILATGRLAMEHDPS